MIDLVFSEFGENLAFSETHFLIDKIFADPSIPRVDMGENIREAVIANIQTFSTNHQIDAMLVPVDHYVDMHTKWLSESPDEIKMDLFTGTLSFCNITPNVFWSNRYMPFDDFPLIDKRFGQWISKPTFAERLTVKVSESKGEEKLDLLFLVYMKYEVLDTNKILILRTPKPYLII